MFSSKSVPPLALTSNSSINKNGPQSSRTSSTACTTNTNETISTGRSQRSNSFQTVSTDIDINLFGLLVDKDELEDESYADYYCETPVLCLAPARRERKKVDLSPPSYVLVPKLKIKNDESAEKAKVALRER